MANPPADFQQRNTYRLLLGLFVTDLVFVFLHVLHKLSRYLTDSSLAAGMDRGYSAFYQNLDFDLLHTLAPYVASPLFNIELDNGYAETYQHLKLVGIIIAFSRLCIDRRSWSFFPWVLLFTYFLLDDALQLHEKLGSSIASNISFVPPLGLRRQDFGELSVTLTAGLIILLPLLSAYYFSRPPLRKTFHDLGLILALLVFFGVGVDMVHVVFMHNPIMSPTLALIEDGGELLSMSVFVWYALSLAKRAACAKPAVGEAASALEVLAGDDAAGLNATGAVSKS